MSCSNKKNTAFTRAYHSVNTRYNVHFNASEAYKESIARKEKQQEDEDNLSKILHVYPLILDSTELKSKGAFSTTIEKTTKAIKLHSISTRPRRDPNRRGDKEYQEWTKRKEFNPFLINTWMLLAKAEFQEGNYLRAITTFLYITKIYNYDKEVVSESKLWIARAYSEMGWNYEAENVLRKMEQNNEIHPSLSGMYASIKANLHIRNKQYESAIPYLEEAITKEKNASQKRRERYLLGQLYAALGEKEKAYAAFGSARGFNAPYNYQIISKLRQLEVSNKPQKEIVSSLKKMTKSSKNEDYLSEIYTVLGDVYLNVSDTLNAIENYSQAVSRDKMGGYAKALAQIKIGGLHFDRREFIQAQPHYSGALPILKKSEEYYPLVSSRSEVLDQLVVHAKVVHEQDSLLLLASLPEDERTHIIEEHIKQLKKEEERKRQEEELEQRKAEYSSQEYTEWDILNRQQEFEQKVQSGNAGEKESFYFYNKNAVEQGKLSFQRKWGKRALEDNWRRRDKSTIDPFGEELEELAEDKNTEADNLNAEGEKELVTDVYSVEYYLQQLPLTDEAQQASLAMIENGLFNMGIIYKNLLEDNNLAIDAFETTLKRFPNTSNKEEIYFQLFLIYLRMDNEPLMTMYRNLLVSEFSSGKYAEPLSDPDYAWNFKYMAKLQEDLYQETYDAYLAADVDKVRKNYETIQQKFPFVSLMPKFALLNSLTYAQTKDARSLEKHLSKLVADYPDSDVTPLATNMLKNIKDGMILLSDGTPITSMDWTMAYANDSLFEGEGARAITYIVALDKPHMLLLVFKPNTIDRNELLYQVADYNFSNYVIQTYDLNFNDSPILSTLEISGFENFKAIKSYLNKAMAEEGLLTKLDEAITPVPISTDNYINIYPRLGLDEYMTFYADSLGAETPQLLAYWKGDRETLMTQIESQIEEQVDTVSVEQNIEVPIVPETGEDKIVLAEINRQADKQPEKQEPEYDKEVSLEDALSKEQVQAIGDINKKYDETIDALQGVIDNPVEGLKNIFNRNNLDDNLTKEEKEERKRIEREEKERQKELQKALKRSEDSIARIEQFRIDSIKRVEQAIQNSIKTAERQKREQIVQERKAAEQKQKELENARKQELKNKEEARKQQLREREERRKQIEKERKELQERREKERRELQKAREEERKQKEKEAEDLRKQHEKGRESMQNKRPSE